MDNKKTEKLVSALYLLTSFFADKEPMKWRLRELGGELLSLKEGSNIVFEIRSLLSVAKNAGLVSDTNFDIIDREFAALVPGSTIDKLLSSVREERESVAPAPVPTVEEERFEEREVEQPAQKPEARTYYLDTPVANRPSLKDKTEKPKEPKQPGTVALKKNNRQNIILNLLKRKKEIQIADVSPLIPGVSEKTIQRELLAMVAAGILNKIGEKRWSRYTLAEE